MVIIILFNKKKNKKTITIITDSINRFFKKNN